MALNKGSQSTPQGPSAQERVKKAFKASVNLEVVKGLKIALHGKEKTGKSHFAGTAPAPIYIIDTEGAWHLNRLAFPHDKQEQIFVSEVLYMAGKKDGKVDVVASLDAAMEAIDALTTLIRETPPEKTGTIVVDSVTDIWDWLAIWKDTAILPGPDTKGSRLEWGHANRRYAEFILMLLHSQWHVILTGKSDEIVSDKGVSLGIDRAKWQKKTGYYVDVIAEMKKDAQGVRTLTLKGDRFGDIREVIPNPSWDVLIKAFEKRTGVKFS